MKSYNTKLNVLTIAALVGISSVLVHAEAAEVTREQCTAEKGQVLIEQGRYESAIREFTCMIDADPTAVEGYRGRIEARLLLGRYSDALGDYARVTALVLPVHADARNTILEGYAARLAIAPDNVAALTGASFARWFFFEYAQAAHLLNHLIEVEPDNVYGNLFRGSSRVLNGGPKALGAADMDHALALAPGSPDVRFIVSDAYTYGMSNPERALAEGTLALEWGLDTPRVHAILGSAYTAFGDVLTAARHIQRHIDLVTSEVVSTTAMAPGESLDLEFVPGRSYEIPIPVMGGETISIATTSRDFWDSIAVLIAPDGSPVIGSDDANAYFAAFDWAAPRTGTYRLQVTFFESINSGVMTVTYK